MRLTRIAMAALVLSAVTVTGCGNPGGYHEVAKGSRVTEQPHEHDHGPHGGHVVELGQEEHHAEVVFSPKSQSVVVYILDSSAKTSEPIEAKELTLNLTLGGKPTAVVAKASPQAGDPPGRASRFEATGNAAVKASVKDEEDLKGSLTVVIAGKSFTGDIKHDH